jgi:hypothetical protein
VKKPTSYCGVAFNEVPDSANQIHGDDMAARFGFEGGLVPGVTVSAYLAHPAVTAWGMDYVARGAARVVVKKPVYDGHAFSVEVSAQEERAYDAVLRDQSGDIRASAHCWLPEVLPVAPQRRGDATIAADFERPPGTPDIMRRLQRRGMGAMRIRWDESSELTTYFRDSELMPTPLKTAGGRHAHAGFVLGMTNWVLDSNVLINPWLHLQTDSQCFHAIEPGTELIVEAAIVDLFEKKGHQFCDVQVSAFRSYDDVAVMHTRLRAIYQLRGP